MAEIALSMAIKQADGLLGKLVGKLYTAVSEELSMLLGVRKEIQYIKDELEVIIAFLRKAEEKQNSDIATKAWVKQVKELSYAVEDCIDEFTLHLSHGNRDNNAVAASWRCARLTCCWVDADIQSTSLIGSLQSRHRIATDMQSIKSRVEEVSKRRKRYGIDDKVPRASDNDVNAQYDPRSAALFVDDSQLVGIDKPREKLVNWLLDGQLLDDQLLDDQPSLGLIDRINGMRLRLMDRITGTRRTLVRQNNQPLEDSKKRSLRLMVVVGSGGLGKTTIVRRAVESPKVTGGHFDCRAWVTVSQVYQIEGLLRDLIKQIVSPPPNDLETRGKMNLIESLQFHLRDKSYAIVFDDIWKVDAWNGLEVALPRNTKGSRIIVTTRIDDVAGACLACIPGDRHEQGKLSEDQSWDLFCKRMFPKQTCPKELETSSRSILKKCDGMPLAIVAIAAALASKPKKTEKEWNDMLTHLSTEFESNPNLQGVMHVLNFSYTDLPYHVKQCFLYLSKFPDNSLISCNRIKRLWIAEGFVSGHRDMAAEDVADSYLNVLISRSLILPSVFTVTGELKSFTVHDVMMEMIVSMSMEENFVHLLKKDNKWLPHGVTRRLSIHTEHVPEDINLAFVRSMTIFGNGTPSFLSQSSTFNLLRVLDFNNCTSLRNEHLEVICGLLHLKYLCIRNAYHVKILPDSIGNLQNLETLDFRGCFDMPTIPPKILNLKQLRFLRGTDFEFPGKVGKPSPIRELGFVVLKRGMAKDLQHLDQLKKLRVRLKDFEGNDASDLCDFLKMEGNSLRTLSVDSKEDLTFLKDLSSAPATLENLGLAGSLYALPRWVSSLRNLHKITFWYTKLKADAMQDLGALPSLLELVLYAGSYGEEKLAFGAKGFQSLKVLRCNYVFGDVRSLIFEKGALPCVESVHVIHLTAQGIIGLENLTCLKTVEIQGMVAEAEAAVKEAVEKNPNHPKLIIK